MMKRIWLIAILVVAGGMGLSAQTGTVQGLCSLGGTKSLTSGLGSTNYLEGIIPSCTVTVFLTGTQTKATIYSDSLNTPLSNPFTANTAASVNPGGWLFYAAASQAYDVVLSGGIAPNTYPSPVTITSTTGSVVSAFTTVNACTYAGGDGGAKVNAADTAYIGVGVEIDVTLACGTTWTTPVVITAGHSLKFIEGGTYTLPYGNQVLGNNVIDFGNATIQLAAQGTFLTNTEMWKTNNGSSTIAANVTFKNGTIDGNYNNVQHSDTSEHATVGIRVQGNQTTAAHDITIDHVAFQNWYGVPIKLSCPLGGPCTTHPNSTHDVTISNSTFDFLGSMSLYLEDFDSNVKFLHNRVTQWAEQGTYGDAFFTVNYETNGLSQQSFEVANSIFINTTTPISNGNYITEMDPTGGWVTGFNYHDNFSNSTAGYIELSVSSDKASIHNNIFLNSGPSELGITNTTVDGNTINGGGITVMPGHVVTSSSIYSNNAVVGNSVIPNGVNKKAILLSGATSGIALVPLTNTTVTGNTIDMTGSSGNCGGIFIGPYDSNGYVQNITISSNQIQQTTATCPGIRIATVSNPLSSGIQILDNTINGFQQAVEGDAYAYDVTIADNKMINDAQTIADFTTQPRQWGNVVSAPDYTQYLNGGSTISIAGYIGAPGGIGNGATNAPPPTNLTGWYAANTVCSSDGANLTSWNPAAAGFGGTLAAGATPAICKLNIVNGLPVVRFSGTANGYAGTLQTTTQPSTVFVIYAKTIGQPASGNAFLYDDIVFPAYNSLFFSNATTIKGNAGSGITAAISDDGNFHTAVFSLDVGGTGTIYLDGIQQATGALSAAGLSGITIGAEQNQTAMFTGDIAEVLVYNALLSNVQMQTVGAYIQGKYGLGYLGAWTITGGKATLSAGLSINGGATMTGNQGTGTKVQHASGATVLNDCGKFAADGSLIDAGITCAGGGGGGGIADIQFTVGTPTIGANTCVVQTPIAMSGLLTTSTITISPAANNSAVAGAPGSPASAGQLYFYPWPTANTLNYLLCNGTSAPITPGGSTLWNGSAQ